MKVEIKIDDQGVRRALNGLIALGKDLSPAMRVIAAALESGVKGSFRSQRSPDGEAWPDLSEVTKARREKRRKWPGQILRLNPFSIRAWVQTKGWGRIGGRSFRGWG